jgi:hypothetical protein
MSASVWSALTGKGPAGPPASPLERSRSFSNARSIRIRAEFSAPDRDADFCERPALEVTQQDRFAVGLAQFVHRVSSAGRSSLHVGSEAELSDRISFMACAFVS